MRLWGKSFRGNITAIKLKHIRLKPSCKPYLFYLIINPINTENSKTFEILNYLKHSQFRTINILTCELIKNVKHKIKVRTISEFCVCEGIGPPAHKTFSYLDGNIFYFILENLDDNDK